MTKREAVQVVIQLQEALGKFVNDVDPYLTALSEEEFHDDMGHRLLAELMRTSVALMGKAERVVRALD